MKTLLTAAMLLLPQAAFAASPLEGVWTNPRHSVTVRIAPCGGNYCGRVIAASAKARADAANGGGGRLIGAELMSGLTQDGPGEWSGSVFVPDHNIHAEGIFRLLGPRQLSVKGCAVRGVLCKEQVWTKVGGGKR